MRRARRLCSPVVPEVRPKPEGLALDLTRGRLKATKESPGGARCHSPTTRRRAKDRSSWKTPSERSSSNRRGRSRAEPSLPKPGCTRKPAAAWAALQTRSSENSSRTSYSTPSERGRPTGKYLGGSPSARWPRAGSGSNSSSLKHAAAGLARRV